MDSQSRVPLLEEYKDDPVAIQAHDDGLPQYSSTADEGRRCCRTRCKRRRRFLFSLITALVTFLVLYNYSDSVTNFGRRVAGRFGCAKKLEFVGEGHRHKLPVPPGIILERCTNWDGKDIDDSLRTFDDPGMGYHHDADGSYWIDRPSPINPQKIAAKSAPKGPYTIQIVNPDSTNRPITSLADFNVSVNQDMFFVSRGSFSAGALSVVQSEERTGEEVRASVEITTNEGADGYDHEKFLELVRVCRIRKEGNQESVGVGIFTPEWKHDGGRRPRHGRHHGRIPKVRVTIELPREKYEGHNEDSSLKVPHFETDMPLFSHDLDLSRDTVVFRDLFVRTANTPVKAKDISALDLRVETHNSAISGKYATWGSIHLSTENAPIDVGLTLWNYPTIEGEAQRATSAKLETKNAPIGMKNILESTSNDKTGGRFNISASTANSPIKIAFPKAPLHSTLDLFATTVLGPIEADMHPTFEGNYYLKTVLMNAEAVLSQSEEDPEGKGRTRSKLYSAMRAHEQATTYWGDRLEEKDWWGNVTLKSSLAPVTMNFPGIRD